MKRRFATIPDEHVVDQLATNIVQQTLTPGWILRRQSPDYFIDWTAELVSNGEPTGKRFSIQQKGHRSIKFKRGFAKEYIKTKHLKYYSQKEQIPVYLFCVDTTSKSVYYIFLQSWIDEYTTEDQLDRKQRIAINIPEGNLLSNISDFKIHFLEAQSYVRKNHPGTIEDAIRQAEKEIEKIDNRWDAKIDIFNASRHVTLLPKECIPIALETSGKISRLIEQNHKYGVPVEWSGEGVKISGSPLFDGKKLQSLTLSPTNSRKVEVRILKAVDGTYLFSAFGTATSGVSGVAFSTTIQSSPLDLEILIPKPTRQDEQLEGQLTLRFSYERWLGKDPLTLPYFPQVADFLAAILSNPGLVHEVFVDGRMLSKGRLGNPTYSEPFEQYLHLVHLIDKVQKIAIASRHSFTLPPLSQFTEEMEERISILYNIMHLEKHTQSGEQVMINCDAPMDPENPDKLSAVIDNQIRAGISWRGESISFQLFGQCITTGPLEYRLHPINVTVPDPQLDGQRTRQRETAKVLIRGSTESVLEVVRSDPKL